VPTALIAHPSADVYGSDGQLLESIDGLRDAGWDVTLCLPASRSLVELVRGSDVQRAPFAVLCKALLGLLPLLRPVLSHPHPRGIVAFARKSGARVQRRRQLGLSWLGVLCCHSLRLAGLWCGLPVTPSFLGIRAR
jgi:hypothetical protein